jgi:hypothetical protein
MPTLFYFSFKKGILVSSQNVLPLSDVLVALF